MVTGVKNKGDKCSCQPNTAEAEWPRGHAAAGPGRVPLGHARSGRRWQAWWERSNAGSPDSQCLALREEGRAGGGLELSEGSGASHVRSAGVKDGELCPWGLPAAWWVGAAPAWVLPSRQFSPRPGPRVPAPSPTSPLPSSLAP